jgi:hypothetical protein
LAQLRIVATLGILRRMRFAVRALVALLIWGMAPGLAEVTENLGHLLATGHTAHAAGEGADHAPQGDEHGCSGAFHLCSCHPSLTSHLAHRARQRRPGAVWQRAHHPAAPPLLDPALGGVERPPRA